MDRQTLTLATADGPCPASLTVPAGGATPDSGVILMMDAFGPRPAMDEMAARLAAAGYTVLVPDLFHRFGAYGPFDAKTAFAQEATKAELMGMIRGTSLAQTESDTAAFLAALDDTGATGKVGVVGYCMGGPRALVAAAAYPDRVVAAASFHGGQLASENDDSPHKRAASMKARLYVGSAGVDGSFPPEQSARLAQALREAEVDHLIENYVGMEHGWCVPDGRAFDPKGAERHWTRLLTLFNEMLGTPAG